MSVEPPESLVIPTDNRPAPLFGTQVGFLADRTAQLSFGERAALEGILNAAKPRLSVETGTYEGGSLRFLAAHSGHVHTIDLYDLLESKEAFGNVTFHVGDSRALLPALLRELEAAGTEVDLVLIDGDHSAEGVRADLESVLESPAAARTLILLHDTMNAEVRSGIEATGLAGRENVVYHELDLVPGYEFVGGHFDGQVWGGLGLVVTGDRSESGYGDSPAQTLYRDPYALYHERVRMGDELARARVELDASRHWLQALESSASWRLTAPLRAAKRRLLELRARRRG